MSVQSGAALSEAGTLTGYCIDLQEAGCSDRFLPFYGMTVDSCEETCTLRNPVPIRGLEATLYDRECVADYDTPMEGRVLILSQRDWTGNLRRQIIDDATSYAIVACPEPPNLLGVHITDGSEAVSQGVLTGYIVQSEGRSICENPVFFQGLISCDPDHSTMVHSMPAQSRPEAWVNTNGMLEGMRLLDSSGVELCRDPFVANQFRGPESYVYCN